MRVSACHNCTDVFNIVETLVIVATSVTYFVGYIAKLFLLIKNIVVVGIKIVTRRDNGCDWRIVHFI